MMDSFKRYYTKKQLAEELGVTETSIDNWRRNGSLPYIKMGATTNSRVLFDMNDVEQFFERRKHNVGERRHLAGLHRTAGFTPQKEEPVVEEVPVVDNYSDMPPDIY